MLARLLQQSGSWRFDFRSALIGAAIAWAIAFYVYIQRRAIQALWLRLLEPVKRWQTQAQRSVEEKYLQVLQETVHGLLLFAPTDPTKVFVPPTFMPPPRLPTTLTAAPTEAMAGTVSFNNLLKGHKRVLITGERGVGRTTALALAIWQVTRQVQPGSHMPPFERFPLWLDLAHLTFPFNPPKKPLELVGALTTAFMPQTLPKWILKQLRAHPSLLLVDNWEAVPPAERAAVAQWLRAAADALGDSLWLIATAPQGYGYLVEADFMPVALLPATGKAAIETLYTGWAELLGRAPEPEQYSDAFYTLLWAGEAGDRPLELTARIHHYLQTGVTPARPTEVFQSIIETLLSLPDLGEDQSDVALEAQRLAYLLLGQIAYAARIENRLITGQTVNELLNAALPPKESRPPKLEGAVQKLLQGTGLFDRGGKFLRFKHFVWEEVCAALGLSALENASALALAHLDDPDWHFLIECYVGLSSDEELIKALLKNSLAPDNHVALLKAARLTILASEEAAWRKYVMKALAQTFVAPTHPDDYRLRIGKALALVAGESARPFYLQALRNAAPAVRAVALRGLGWTGDQQEMRILGAALKDPAFEIRESAVRALGDLGTLGALRFLKDSLPNFDEQLMLVAALALAENPDGWEILRDATQHDDLLVRRAAAHGLGRANAPWVEDTLRALARDDPQWLVRSAAEAALNARQEQKIGNTIPAPHKVESIQWLMAWAARQGLGLGLGEAAMHMLRRALSESEADIQTLAALTLSQIGRREDLELLKPLLASPDAGVNAAAKNAVWQIEQRYLGL